MTEQSRQHLKKTGVVVLHLTRIVTVFPIIWNKVKQNPFTAFLCLSAPLFMFAHIYFLYHPEINRGGIFGYKFWSVFFNSMMWPTFAFAIGYLVQVLSNNYITDKKGEQYANLISIKAYCISAFYYIITIFPYDNSYARIGLNHAWYYIISLVVALLVTMIILRTPKTLKKQIKELKDKVKAIQNTLRNFTDILMKWEYRVDDPAEYRKDIYDKSKESGMIK